VRHQPVVDHEADFGFVPRLRRHDRSLAAGREGNGRGQEKTAGGKEDWAAHPLVVSSERVMGFRLLPMESQIRPEPTPEERVVILAALERLLSADLRPPAYRSAWRDAGIRENLDESAEEGA